MPGKYQASPPTGQEGDIRTDKHDQSNNKYSREAYAPKYEDNDAEVAKVEHRYGYTNIVAAAPTTTVVKASAGFLHAINFTAVANGVITIYDNTAGSGTLIRTITSPATILQDEVSILFDESFATGLTIVTSGAAQDINVSSR